MKIFQGIEELEQFVFPVVTIGTFDGLHFGHKKILNRLKEIAKKYGGETVVITFYPHPRMVLFPDDNDIKLLSSQEEKIMLLEKFGIDNLIIIPFSKEFSRLTSLDFVRNILVNKIGTKKLVIGYDHHFGKNREGSFEHLLEFGPVYGFDVEEIPEQDIDEVAVSSSKIRNSLLEGNVELANTFLERKYSLIGTVVRGDQVGRTLGYPTANINIAFPHKLIPAFGVYLVEVIVEDKKYFGALNIGVRPTLNNKKPQIEVYIFEFDQEIYGKKVEILFIKKIRNEQKFSSLEELKNQIQLDVLIMKNIINENNFSL
ncbi:MAG: bifunctional riboflavin kinase/FAD synthetase [Bacteroidota bacterium]